MKYSESYNPAAPIAQVKLRNLDTLETITNVPMLLDIGVKVSETESLELEGFNQTITVAHYVRLDFIFLNKLFRGKFLVYDQEEGIIGRDILNKFSILFDALNLEWKKLT